MTAASSLPPSTRRGYVGETPSVSRGNVASPTITHEHRRKRPKGKQKLTEGTGLMPGEREHGGFIIPNRRVADPGLDSVGPDS